MANISQILPVCKFMSTKTQFIMNINLFISVRSFLIEIYVAVKGFFTDVPGDFSLHKK